MFIVINKINTDDDFCYSMDKDKIEFAKDEEEVYYIFVKYMQSLLRGDFSQREYLAKDISGYAKEWLKSNSLGEWCVPSQDFGNQSVEFELIDVSDIEIKPEDRAVLKKVLERVV